MRKLRSSYLILSLISLFFVSCGPKKKQPPSVLIIAVESLAFGDLSCASMMDSRLEGFKSVCQDSVYFTHAYTPSTLSNSSLATLLTGLYPSEHKLESHNDYLSEFQESIVESIVKDGVRTSFFSGGGGVWRKSGLDQGFEVFDDNIRISLSKIYRTTEENFNLFLNWLKPLSTKDQFFSVIYLSDILFPNIQTYNKEGVERSLERFSQVREVSESLHQLMENLKKIHRWDNTMVIVVGLNGTSTREGEFKLLNLYSENTHVPLVIKPAKKKRDLGIKWTVDKNVSLVDLGRSLIDYYSLQDKIIPSKKSISILSSLEKPSSDWDNDRPIFMQMIWQPFLGKQSKRKAVREGRMLYINDREPKLYNTLLDRQERSSIDDDNKHFIALLNKMVRLDKAENSPWRSTKNSIVFLNQFINYYWINRNDYSDWPTSLLLSEAKSDRIFASVLTNLLLENKKWDVLLENAQQNSNKIWEYIAKKNLIEEKLTEEDERVLITKIENNCFKYFLNKNEKKFLQNCNDKLSVAFWSWNAEQDKKIKNKKFSKLNHEYNFFRLKRKIFLYNIAFGFPWFYLDENSHQLHWFDQLIYLPKYRRLNKRLIKNQISIKI